MHNVHNDPKSTYSQVMHVVHERIGFYVDFVNEPISRLLRENRFIVFRRAGGKCVAGGGLDDRVADIKTIPGISQEQSCKIVGVSCIGDIVFPFI